MQIQPKPYIDNIKLRNKAYGTELRRNMTKWTLDNNIAFPQPVTYSDIDKEFKKWAEDKFDISFEGSKIPTFMLFSNQRISEYYQTWKYQDENGNILMNFKTISRENNPQQGKQQDGYFNIPGDDRFYPMFQVPVLQENGQEAIDLYSMRQPYAVDFKYKLSIITNKYELINEFNETVLFEFRALQNYIKPKGYYMSLVLDNTSDESEYAIDDRKYYSQSYDITLKGYIIREEDLKVTRMPSRLKIRGINEDNNKPRIEVEETWENPCNKPDDPEEGRYQRKDTLKITVNYPTCTNKAIFEMPQDLTLTTIIATSGEDNVYDFVIYNNGEKVDFDKEEIIFYEGDEITIEITRYCEYNTSQIVIMGITGDVYDTFYDPESSLDEIHEKHIEMEVDVPPKDGCLND